MNVLFDDVGQLEVDDSLDAGDVETSGGDVGRQEDVDLLVFEAPEISVVWEIFHQILFRNLECNIFKSGLERLNPSFSRHIRQWGAIIRKVAAFNLR